MTAPRAPATLHGRRSPQLSRLGLTLLAAGFCMALAGQEVMNWQLQSAPVFGSERNVSRAGAYGHLSGAVDPLMVKYGYALRHERFRYGLFGSSRVLSVSHRHLGVLEDEFFNFAAGGISLRQSVALLQALHDAGKAPEIAVISLDNHDIRYFRHVEWPPFWSAPGYHLDYLRDELASGTSPDVMLRAAAEIVLVGMQSMVTAFHHERLSRIGQFFEGMPVDYPAPYRPDGSRVKAVDTPVEDGEPVFITYAAAWPSMVAGMQADIARLGRLAAAGIRIIVYESPVAPQLTGTVAAQRDTATVQLRDRIAEACRQHGLTCLPAPQLPAPADDPWQACCHAPPALLGRYIAGLL